MLSLATTSLGSRPAASLSAGRQLEPGDLSVLEQPWDALSIRRSNAAASTPLTAANFAPDRRRLDPLNVTIANDTYMPAPFANTRDIVKMHDAPRFGHSSNISLLASEGSSDASRDYAVGCFICSILIFATFVVWGLALFVARVVVKEKNTTNGCSRRRRHGSSQKHIEDPSSKSDAAGADNLEDLPVKEEVQVPPSSSQSAESALVETSHNGGIEKDTAGSERLDEGVDVVSCRAGNNGEEVDVSIACHTSTESLSVKEGDIPVSGSGHSGSEQIVLATDVEKLAGNDDVASQDTPGGSGSFLQQSEEKEECWKEDKRENAEGQDDSGLQSSKDADNAEGSEEIISSKESTVKDERNQRRLLWIRVLILFCGLAICACAGLMMAKGFHSLTKSLRYIGSSLEQGQNVSNRALDITDEFLHAQNESKAAVELYQKYKPDVWCPPAWNSTNDTIHDAIEEVNEMMESAFDAITPILGKIVDTVLSLQDDLYWMIDLFDTIHSYANTFEWAHYVAAAFVAILVVMVVVIMVDTCLHLAHVGHFGDKMKSKAWKPIKCLGHAAFNVIFWIMLFLMWLFSTIFVLGSIVSADFCVDSPDRHISNILQREGEDQLGSFAYGMLQFYINGCNANYKPTDMEKEFWYSMLAIDALHAVLMALEEIPLQQLVNYCGEQSAALGNVTKFVDKQLHTYITALLATRELFFCENVYPIYGEVAHDSVCYSGVTGLTWLFSTQFAIAVLCMIIITCRVVLDDYEKVDAKESKTSGNRCCLSSRSKYGGSDPDEPILTTE